MMKKPGININPSYRDFLSGDLVKVLTDIGAPLGERIVLDKENSARNPENVWIYFWTTVLLYAQ